MPARNDLGTCRCKVGLLFLHDCNEVAIDLCGRCGRPICAMHQVVMPRATCCPECAASQEPDAQGEPNAGAQTPEGSAQVDSVLRRRQYYHDYEYQPYYWGHHVYFSDNDYRVFDEKDVVQHEMPQEDLGGGGDFDSAVES